MGLGNILSVYRTAIAAAVSSIAGAPTFKNLAEGEDIEDVAQSRYPAFQIVMTSRRMSPTGTFGGAHAVHDVVIELDVRWNPQNDSEAIYDKMATDTETIDGVMMKASNMSAADGQLTPMNPLDGWQFSKLSTNEVQALGRFSLKYRLTQDLS